MKTTIHPTVIYRTPRFSFIESLEENWIVLKDAIKDASPEFYKIIRTMNFSDLKKAEPKIQQTVQKYYNRATFRSTPYGAFSSVSMGKFDRQKNNVIELEEKVELHSFMDWKNTEVRSEIQVDSSTQFFSNTTFYRVQDEIRYLQKADDEFHMAMVDYDVVIWEILVFCAIPKTLGQVTGHFSGLNNVELADLLKDIVDLQLLFTSQHPNIIGEDYFSRVGLQQDKDNKKYLIAERKARTGTFDQALFRHLPELVQILQKIGVVYNGPELREFRNGFIKKYEMAEVPLMEALDPDVGLGYGSFASHLSKSPMAKQIEKQVDDNSIERNKLRDALYIEILENSNTDYVIDLSKLVPETNKVSLLPNSFNAVCSVADGKVWLEGLGGASATALSARFALAMPEIKEYCKEIAALEQRANPNVLFFDVGYTKEIAVDNINRRPAIYDQQLNILNYDTSANPLSVNDILITIQEGEVVLKSRSLGKRLIPRAASAYNHKRSDLPLLRLLMDIQYQGLGTNLLPRLPDIIPGLSYYPRVQFRNIILSPAIWLVRASILKGDTLWDQKCTLLQKHLKARLNCSHVKAGMADQTLCLNINSISDIELMLSLLEKQKQLYLEETQIPMAPIAVDNHQKPMLPQLILTLTHGNEIYKTLRPSVAAKFSSLQKTWVAPGNDWLYFEIYLNAFRSDMLLDSKINGYLHRNGDKIKSWFFIRYSEDGDHIRLRLKLSDQQYGYLLIRQLTDLINDELEAGIVTDIRLRTYKKEVNRYSDTLIDKVEEHFYRDSQFVLSMLSAMLPDMAKYKLCINIVEAIAATDVLAGDGYIDTAKQMAGYLGTEHGFNTADFKEVNELYRSYLQEDFPPLSTRSAELHSALIMSFIETIRQYEAINRQQILADLIHMHINRLFVTDQRLHELIIYIFYLRKQMSDKNRKRSLTHPA